MLKILKGLYEKCFGDGTFYDKIMRRINNKLFEWEQETYQRQLERETARRKELQKKNMEKYGIPYTPSEYLKLLGL